MKENDNQIVKASLHEHIKTGKIFGDDCIFNRVIDKVRRRLGKEGIIGLTNYENENYEHFIGLRGYERFDFGNAIYISDKNVWVIKTQEIPTKEGDLLAIGIDKGKHLKGYRSLDDSIKEARDNNAVVAVPHPFLQGIGQLLVKNPEYLGKVDAIEIHNSGASIWIPGITGRNVNKKAIDFYLEMVYNKNVKIGAIASGDGHSIYDIGTSYTAFSSADLNFKNSESIRNNLRNAVRKSKHTGCHMRNCAISGLDHFIDLMILIGAGKLKLDNLSLLKNI